MGGLSTLNATFIALSHARPAIYRTGDEQGLQKPKIYRSGLASSTIENHSQIDRSFSVASYR